MTDGQKEWVVAGSVVAFAVVLIFGGWYGCRAMFPPRSLEREHEFAIAHESIMARAREFAGERVSMVECVQWPNDPKFAFCSGQTYGNIARWKCSPEKCWGLTMTRADKSLSEIIGEGSK